MWSELYWFLKMNQGSKYFYHIPHSSSTTSLKIWIDIYNLELNLVMSENPMDDSVQSIQQIQFQESLISLEGQNLK